MDRDSEIRRLREEIEALRAAVAAQEEHLILVSEEMNAMLLEVEKQRNDLTAAHHDTMSLTGLLDRIFETLEDLVVFAGADGRIRRLNRRRARWMGFDPDHLIGARLDDLLSADDLRVIAKLRPDGMPNLRGLLWEQVCAFGNFSGEVRLRLPESGEDRIWLLRATIVLTPQYKIDGVVAIFTDITDRREAETAMRLAASVFQSIAQGIMITDTDGRILSVNPAFTAITGFTAEEAVGATPRILKSGMHDKGFLTAMWRAPIEHGCWKGDAWNQRKNGELFLMRGSINVIHDSAGRPGRYVLLFDDATDLWHREERTRHLAFHDPLTGLANRSLLFERLERGILQARRDKSRIALMFVDLDGFKIINDTLGHANGDKVLKIVAARLKSLMRAADTIARVGGDEFVLLLENISPDQNALASVADRIVEAVGEPVKMEGRDVRIGASIGLVIYPDNGEDAQTLLKNADEAMYAAKADGKNGFRFFRQSAR